MPRVVDHSQRRREIVYAVWSVIARRGIEGVTLRSVAAEAGISVGRIQHYYATREELVRDGCRAMIELAAGVEPDSDLPPAEQLRALILGTVPTTPEFRIGTAVWLAYVAKSVDDPVIAEMITAAHRESLAGMCRLLRDAGARGDIESAATTLLAAAEGCALRVLVGGLTAADATAALEAALAGLLPAVAQQRP